MNPNDTTDVSNNDVEPLEVEEDTRPLVSINKQKLNKLVKNAPKYALYSAVAIISVGFVSIMLAGGTDKTAEPQPAEETETEPSPETIEALVDAEPSVVDQSIDTTETN